MVRVKVKKFRKVTIPWYLSVNKKKKPQWRLFVWIRTLDTELFIKIKEYFFLSSKYLTKNYTRVEGKRGWHLFYQYRVIISRSFFCISRFIKDTLTFIEEFYRKHFKYFKNSLIVSIFLLDLQLWFYRDENWKR